MPADDIKSLLDMDLGHGEGDWAPTPHGVFLADVLAAHREIVAEREVLELGGGLGNHTILLARLGAKRIVTTEILADRSETTRKNVESNCPGFERIEYRVADWLDTPGTFDLLVTNPPFAKSGMRNRRYFIDSLILDAHKRLRPGGELVFVQSSMADLAKTKRRLEQNGFTVAVLRSRAGAFRDYYFEDPSFMEEIKHVENGFEIRDGTYYETLHVVRATLEPWRPPSGAHLP